MSPSMLFWHHTDKQLREHIACLYTQPPLDQIQATSHQTHWSHHIAAVGMVKHFKYLVPAQEGETLLFSENVAHMQS